MRKKMTGRIALLFVLIMALTGCAKGNTVDKAAEAANVGGVSVPVGEVNFWLRYQQAQMQGMYGAMFGEDFMNQDLIGLGTVYGESVRDMALETLEEYYVVEAHAQELGVSLSDEEKTAASDAAKAFLAANGSNVLDAMSADEATVTHVLELAALRNKVYEDRAATIDQTVDPEEAAQKKISYVFSSKETTDENGNTVTLSEDELSGKRADMEAVLTEAKAGGDLSAAAQAHEMSAVPATYGIDDTSLNETMRAEADAMSDGEFSGLIDADDGFYIVYMESTYDEDATQTKTESILREREQEAYSAWLDPLKEAAAITVNEEAVSKLTFERIFNAAVPEEEAEPEAEDEAAGEEE